VRAAIAGIATSVGALLIAFALDTFNVDAIPSWLFGILTVVSIACAREWGRRRDIAHPRKSGLASPQPPLWPYD